MSSSDSEDCYGNVAIRLHNMKSKYIGDSLANSNLLNDSKDLDDIVKTNTSVTKKTNQLFVASEEPVLSTPLVSKEILTVPETRVLTRRITRASTRRHVPEQDEDNSPESQVPELYDGNSVSTQRLRGRSCGRGRGRGQRRPMLHSDQALTGILWGGEREDSPVPTELHSLYGTGTTRPRGRGRNSQQSPNSRRQRRGNSSHLRYPTYSVGNTDDYPDQSNNQALFSINKNSEEVIFIDDNEIMDENEELSVKVYWQSTEIFKFTIRKFQKIAQIFDYFSKKENVNRTQLLFTYNDKILQPDDTPDMINYNIVKFIDGGIIHQNVTELVGGDRSVNVKTSVKIKFQCQNVKKPFEIDVNLDDKFLRTMIKCAEHLEKPLAKLRFEFDGDTLSGARTGRELELEGGECVDVRQLP